MFEYGSLYVKCKKSITEILYDGLPILESVGPAPTLAPDDPPAVYLRLSMGLISMHSMSRNWVRPSGTSYGRCPSVVSACGKRSENQTVERGHTASVSIYFLNSDNELLAALAGRQEPRASGTVSSDLFGERRSGSEMDL